MAFSQGKPVVAMPFSEGKSTILIGEKRDFLLRCEGRVVLFALEGVLFS